MKYEFFLVMKNLMSGPSDLPNNGDDVVNRSSDSTCNIQPRYYGF